MPMMVSVMVQVRRVWETVRPRQSLTIQKPPSLRWERKREPQPIAMMRSSGLVPGLAARTGTRRPEATVMETVAEPVETRMKAETSQP